MVSASLMGITLGTAVVDWLAVFKNWKRLEYLAKPGAMLALFFWLVSYTGLEGVLAWFALGLILSLAGDVFLMLPQRFFIPGLVSFLFAHMAYVTGLNISSQVVPVFPAFLYGFILLLVGYTLFMRIREALIDKGIRALQWPVLAYTIVISLMVLSALLSLHRPEWQTSTALITASGAILFFLSDTLLAWNRFVRPVRNGRLANMILYHLGQVFLIAGVAMNFVVRQ